MTDSEYMKYEDLCPRDQKPGDGLFSDEGEIAEKISSYNNSDTQAAAAYFRLRFSDEHIRRDLLEYRDSYGTLTLEEHKERQQIWQDALARVGVRQENIKDVIVGIIMKHIADGGRTKITEEGAIDLGFQNYIQNAWEAGIDRGVWDDKNDRQLIYDTIKFVLSNQSRFGAHNGQSLIEYLEQRFSESRAQWIRMEDVPEAEPLQEEAEALSGTVVTEEEPQERVEEEVLDLSEEEDRKMKAEERKRKLAELREECKRAVKSRKKKAPKEAEEPAEEQEIIAEEPEEIAEEPAEAPEVVVIERREVTEGEPVEKEAEEIAEEPTEAPEVVVIERGEAVEEEPVEKEAEEIAEAPTEAPEVVVIERREVTEGEPVEKEAEEIAEEPTEAPEVVVNERREAVEVEREKRRAPSSRPVAQTTGRPMRKSDAERLRKLGSEQLRKVSEIIRKAVERGLK